MFLMSEFIRNGFKHNRLARLNRCRLFLQVYTLADICSGDGRKICPEFLSGHNPMRGCSRIHWPNQGQPPPANWHLCRESIQKCFLSQRNVLRIHNPLGKWLLKAPAHWPCWYDVIDHSVYLQEDRKWRQFRTAYQGLQIQPSFIRHTLHESLPPNTLQAIG
jgi:hypothetical protein